MKIVNIDEVQVGDILARTLYYPFGGVMIKAGASLDRAIIAKLKEIGYKYIYIYDETIGDIEYYDTLDELQKINLTRKIRETFSELRHEVGTMLKMESIKKISPKEVSTLLENEELLASQAPKFRLNFIQDVYSIIEKLISESEFVLSILTIKNASEYLYDHSIEVTIKSLLLGKRLGLTKPELVELGVGALLHDIGYSMIPENILNKEGRLTEHEKKILQLHPSLGYTILKNHPCVSIISAHVAYQHHEQQDGKGFPRGLKGTNKITHRKRYEFETEPKILRFAEIVAVADYYDLLLTDLPYRKACGVDEAYTKLKSVSGTMLNKEIVETFFEFLPLYPIGTQVLFTGGKFRGYRGVVIKNFPGSPQEPLVKITTSPSGEKISKPFEVDLREERYPLKSLN